MMLSAPAEVMLSYLIGLAPVGATIEPSLDTLSSDLGYNQKASIYRLLSELISGGYVKRIATGRNGSIGVLLVKKRQSPAKPIDLDRRLKARLEILEEENRQLKDRIAQLVGQSSYELARVIFGLTPKQAMLFNLLVARGQASRDQILETAYDTDSALSLEDSYQAVGTLVKNTRRAVAPFGVKIATCYGMGWRMDDASRSLAQSILRRSHSNHAAKEAAN